MRIVTSAKFEAAHRLSFYDGKCNRLHGHNWKVDLEIYGDMPKISHLLFDFTHLKKIADKFDHKILVLDSEENRRILENVPDDWIVWIGVEPTAEHLARLIRQKIIDMMPEELVLTGKVVVRVWESDHSYAEVNGRDS